MKKFADREAWVAEAKRMGLTIWMVEVGVGDPPGLEEAREARDEEGDVVGVWGWWDLETPDVPTGLICETPEEVGEYFGN